MWPLPSHAPANRWNREDSRSFKPPPPPNRLRQNRPRALSLNSVGPLICSLTRHSRITDLDFRVIRGHPEPDQAEGDGQPLVDVHLDILTGLRGRERNPFDYICTASKEKSRIKWQDVTVF